MAERPNAGVCKTPKPPVRIRPRPYHKQEVIMNLTPNDKLKLEGALKDMSTSMTRVEAERDLQKNVIGDICEELNLNKKVFRKLAKVYHKQNFDDEVNTHHEFEKLYETVTNKTK